MAEQSNYKVFGLYIGRDDIVLQNLFIKANEKRIMRTVIVRAALLSQFRGDNFIVATVPEEDIEDYAYKTIHSSFSVLSDEELRTYIDGAEINNDFIRECLYRCVNVDAKATEVSIKSSFAIKRYIKNGMSESGEDFVAPAPIVTPKPKEPKRVEIVKSPSVASTDDTEASHKEKTNAALKNLVSVGFDM